MHRVRGLLLALVLLAACSSAPTAEPAPVSPTPASPALAPQPDPTSSVVVSDAVPTLDELRDMGLSDVAAECFIETIDPENTGTVQSADLFMQAFGACL